MNYRTLLIVLIISFGAHSQDSLWNFGPPNLTATGQIDGVWLNQNILTQQKMAYPSVREADVMWSKRVWRVLDMREKLNHSIYYPLDEVTDYEWVRNSSRWSLWTIIRKHVMNGDLQVFSPYNPVSYGLGRVDGDQLKYPISPDPGKNFYTDESFRDEMVYYLGYLGEPGTTALVDEYGEPYVDYNQESNKQVGEGVDAGNTSVNGNSLGISGAYRYDDPDTIWYNSEDIVEYRLKEDWFFDKSRSEMDVRIIAMAPVVYTYVTNINGDREISGKKELFWLYFPHCRSVLNNYYVHNSHNDAYPISFDDLFMKRRFSSYIVKESNVYGRSIESYRHGVDALHESEKITNQIRTFEQDLWSF